MFSHRLPRVLWLAAGLTTGEVQANQTNTLQPTHLDPVIVIGRKSVHEVASESELVGPAQQPEWTTRRVFAETDIYVIPPGEIEFNQFYVLSHPREGKAEHLFESELEIGLPWRTQIDIEPNYSITDGNFNYDSTRIELPHALADWGKIPLNPAIDVGWRFVDDAADSFLVRLLLAEQFGKRWHFGGNFGYQQQVGDERETEFEINAALSYVLLDRKLTLGVEFLAEFESEEDEGEYESTVLLGPALLYKPTRDTHLGFVAFAGLTEEAPAVELFFVFGFDLEPFTWNWGNEESMAVPEIRRPR